MSVKTTNKEIFNFFAYAAAIAGVGTVVSLGVQEGIKQAEKICYGVAEQTHFISPSTPNNN